MSRHKSRLDRLTRGMGASAEDFRSARWDRMTDEELLAEAVVAAVKAGFNPEIARTDLDAAIAWVEAEGGRSRRWRSKPGSIQCWRGRIG